MSKSIGQLVGELQTLKSKEEANRFLIKELQFNSNAWTNIKYVAGYLSDEERKRILNLFDAE